MRIVSEKGLFSPWNFQEIKNNLNSFQLYRHLKHVKAFWYFLILLFQIGPKLAGPISLHNKENLPSALWQMTSIVFKETIQKWKWKKQLM